MRALALVFILMPGAALAQVCDAIRPGWTPQTGAMGALEELASAMLSPFGLGALALTLAGLLLGRVSSRICAALLILLGLSRLPWFLGLLLGDDAGLLAAARAEGCLGPAWPVTALLLACAGLVIARNARRRAAA